MRVNPVITKEKCFDFQQILLTNSLRKCMRICRLVLEGEIE